MQGVYPFDYVYIVFRKWDNRWIVIRRYVGWACRIAEMIESSEFVDHYEILKISANADLGAIERMFRYLAQRYHPDNRDTGDRLRFDVILEAHNTLRDPVKRARYDIQRGSSL